MVFDIDMIKKSERSARARDKARETWKTLNTFWKILYAHLWMTATKAFTEV
jgi:hypothetical protein